MQIWQDKMHDADTNTEVAGPAQKAAIKNTTATRVPAWAIAGGETLPAGLQAKLTINQPGDVYEQEADRVAEEVMRMPAGGTPGTHEDMPVMRKESSGGQASHDAPPVVQQALSSGGQPLDAGTQETMGAHFGLDFRRVRVHTDGQSGESAQAINARAYTVGSDIVFGEGQYRPETGEGQRLLAHELTHVVQQGKSNPQSFIAPTGGVAERGESVLRSILKEQPLIVSRRTGERIAREEAGGEAKAPGSGISVKKKSTADLVIDELNRYVPEASGGVGDYKAGVDILRGIPTLQELLDTLMEIARKNAGYLDMLLQGMAVFDPRLYVALNAARYRVNSASVTGGDKKQTRVNFDQMDKGEQEIITYFLGDLTTELLGKDVQIEKLANIQFSFMEEKRKREEEEKRAAEIEAKKKAGEKAPTSNVKVEMGKMVEKDVKKGGFPTNPVSEWTSLSPADQNNWKNRAAAAWNSLVASVKGTELENVAKGKSFRFEPETALKNSWYAWKEGTTLVFGMSWVKNVEANPKNGWSNLAHEMAGHFEYGTTYVSEIMAKVIEKLPQDVRDKLNNDPKFRTDFFGTYEYQETEIYAALRELRYRVPLAGLAPESGAIHPYDNIQLRLSQMKEFLAPEVAVAVLKELKRRVDSSSEILPRDKSYFADQVKKIFGNIF